MRSLYIFALRLLAPFLILRLYLKARRQPAYGLRIGERFGRVPIPAGDIAVWVHAVSVGETLAALPLIEALIRRHGERSIWVTTTTPTGSDRVIAALRDRVHHSYVPYDLPGTVARFLDRVRPRQLIVMETELWPTLFRQCRQRGITVIIANARLSPRSLRGYARIPVLAASTLADCSAIATQSKAHARRFLRLGAKRDAVAVIGNLKFDLAIPDASLIEGQLLRAHLGGAARRVWIAASTHEGEERAALDAHAAVLEAVPTAILILVPRHPHRFDEVQTLAERSGLRVGRRSGIDFSRDLKSGHLQILIGDSMGEMFMYLAASDVAFIGGSLVDIGGHNVLEPAALGLPVLFGPHMHNFSAARSLLLEREAAVEVADAAGLAAEVASLLGDAARCADLGRAGRDAVAGNRGALNRLLTMLDAVSAARAPMRQASALQG